MNNPGVVVPPVPEKNPFGRFSEQFIQQRRLALEKCIQKIANHPVLCRDQDLKFFLENDNFALDVSLFVWSRTSVVQRLFYVDQAEKSRDGSRERGVYGIDWTDVDWSSVP